MPAFFQSGPEFDNPYNSDELLKSYLMRKFDSDEFTKVEADLSRFGDRLITDIRRMAEDAEQYPPRLRQFDPWGRRIDQIDVAAGWVQLEAVSAEESLVASGYTRPYGAKSRLFQFVKLMLFHPNSAFYTCPLAMTDGAARIIELSGDDHLMRGAFQHLISTDPKTFWTSGQWMTEKIGGSDVSQTETIARFEDGTWRLYGTKWFTSATTSQMAMALARIEDKDGTMIPGSKGLSLFYVETRDSENNLQNIEILRLKDKLGTKALPTAEIELRGAPGKLIGERGRGVKTIAALLNITRLYNACTTVGAFKHLLGLATDYAQKRFAFGKPIANHPLHAQSLAAAEVDYHACFHLTFQVAELLGWEECPHEVPGEIAIDEVKALLRLLTPVAKLYTAKVNLYHTTELIEGFGGVGYIEDSGLPKLLRDNQVFTIWEGTTNVLSLDVLRAMQKEAAFAPFVRTMNNRLESVDSSQLVESRDKVKLALNELTRFMDQSTQQDQNFWESRARNIAFSIANITSAVALLEHAQSQFVQENAISIANYFCRRTLMLCDQVPGSNPYGN